MQQHIRVSPVGRKDGDQASLVCTSKETVIVTLSTYALFLSLWDKEKERGKRTHQKGHGYKKALSLSLLSLLNTD